MGASILRLTGRPLRVALAAGGTGGHVVPALALAEAMREGPVNGIAFEPAVLLGCHGGMEESLAAEAHVTFAGLPKPKAVGFTEKLRAPLKLGAAVWQARRELRERDIEVVVGFGGYASAAPLIAGWLSGLPTILCEQNARAGRTNRRLARFASLVAAQFEECRGDFPARCQLEVLGNPLRRAVRSLAAYRDLRASAIGRAITHETTLLVMGGSQGAQPINRLLFEALPALKLGIPKLHLIALVGEKETLPIAARCAELGLPAEVLPFHGAMHELYRRADFVVARSGATTLAELTAIGLPMGLIPFPQAMDDHQTCNALSLAAAGAAHVWPQAGLTPEGLAVRVVEALADRGGLAAMKKAARKCGQPDSGLRILGRIADIVNGVRVAGEQQAA